MRRLPLLLALAAAAPLHAQQQPPPLDPAMDRVRYDGCVRAIPTDAAKAADYALQWQGLGGGLPARHCQALAQLQLGQFAAAAATLVKAAEAAEAVKSPLAADFWGQAGNASFLAGDARGAIARFTTALVSAGEFAPQRSANLLIDRARAHAELGDLAAARTDLDKALALSGNEAAGWILSAALARRQQDLARARADIARATALAPADPDVLFEQGNIAAAGGEQAAARTAWEQVVKTAPESEAAALARKALAPG